ncbi:hypothetical protein KPH14_004581 [Odynerus spinipes]|uniref:Uncharacterized protein n=1 Tax=Odynerus spinipes TaxID=1348599 RepID=A0AAD9RM19_9HYME|nr:hypothetical protein KPH14_004581 [Odynerus spinipes]
MPVLNFHTREFPYHDARLPLKVGTRQTGKAPWLRVKYPRIPTMPHYDYKQLPRKTRENFTQRDLYKVSERDPSSQASFSSGRTKECHGSAIQTISTEPLEFFYTIL